MPIVIGDKIGDSTDTTDVLDVVLTADAISNGIMVVPAMKVAHRQLLSPFDTTLLGYYRPSVTHTSLIATAGTPMLYCAWGTQSTLGGGFDPASTGYSLSLCGAYHYRVVGPLSSGDTVTLDYTHSSGTLGTVWTSARIYNINTSPNSTAGPGSISRYQNGVFDTTISGQAYGTRGSVGGLSGRWYEVDKLLGVYAGTCYAPATPRSNPDETVPLSTGSNNVDISNYVIESFDNAWVDDLLGDGTLFGKVAYGFFSYYDNPQRVASWSTNEDLGNIGMQVLSSGDAGTIHMVPLTGAGPA